MSERLRQFVVDVSSDPDRAKRLSADPQTELDQSDLSPEEKQIILSRDPDAVLQAMGPERSDFLAMNSFFKKPPKKPGPPKPPRPPKPRPGRTGRRKPARKAPAKKTTTRRATKRAAAPKRTSRKSTAKTTRKTARKGSRGRR
jgi:hypothetical protein